MEPKLKAGLAAGVAIAALGTAGYLGYTSLGGGRTVRTAAQASAESSPGPGAPREDAIPEGLAENESGGNDSTPGERTIELSESMSPQQRAWIEQTQARAEVYADEYEFPAAEAASRSFEEGSVDLALRAESDDALDGLGITSRRGLIDAFRAIMQPLVDADKDGFERALRDLGAPNPEGGLTLYDRLVGYMEGSRVALASARLRAIDPRRPGALPMGMPNLPNLPTGEAVTAIPMMVGVMEFQDDASGETTTIREVNIPLDAVFPGARETSLNGARTAEVWAPAQFAKTRGGRADLGPSIFFVYDDQARAWQPVAMRVALASESAASKLEEMMRNRRRATED